MFVFMLYGLVVCAYECARGRATGRQGCYAHHLLAMILCKSFENNGGTPRPTTRSTHEHDSPNGQSPINPHPYIRYILVSVFVVTVKY